jgi:cation diffusion facilitator family transporter
MHINTLNNWQHNHDFAVIHDKGERRTKQVLVLTFFTMIVEILAGIKFGSMALLADGWHMSTHVVAFMITVFAYRYSRVHANDQTFAFSTAKVGVLGGYASSIALAVVALVMIIESVQRLFDPNVIHFNEAIAVATFGFVINLVSVLLLKDHHHHDHHNHHHDQNLKAAYLHVLADALTSILAIIALLAGKYYAWNWLDPVMGIVGAAVITRWAYTLLKETSPILLDESVEKKYKQAVKEKIENDSDNCISDLHIWRIGPNHYAIIISLVTHSPKPPEYYKSLLEGFHKLGHITIEVNQCVGESCIA